jgi:hypothetical protein
MDDPSRIRPDDQGKPPGAEEGVPEALRAELSRLYAPGDPIEVPSEIDERMAQMAHWRLSGRVVETAGRVRGLSWDVEGSGAKRRVFPMRLVTISAAAAALLLVTLIAPRLMNTPAKTGNVAQGPARSGTSIALRGDADADGRVDIVDALVVAKLAAKDPVVSARLSSHAPNPDLDVNADGVVDENDALALRAMVVKLEGGAG